MPVSRMRMRPWLESMIDSNSIPGLSWIDKDKTMFSIPWKHAARHGWEMDKDACLFKRWAIHTGKYSDGQACDPKTWKANFRCAMNSLPDIEEVKDKSINKGHAAVRVFRMLPSSPKSKDKRSKAKESKSRKKSTTPKTEDDTDYSDSQSPVSLTDEAVSTQERTFDGALETEREAYLFPTPPEEADWNLGIDMGTDMFAYNMPHRLEVSPDHSPDNFEEEYSKCDEEQSQIIEICKQLVQNTESPKWRFSSDNMDFLNNEVCTSPESQWSDSSSELEDGSQYTLLNLTPDCTDELLQSFSQQLLKLT